ncbi:arylsulfatase B [Patella vulgata]|uniref:arylsulfatase B n=1 Tax=Patella vulgata TaxID=6465 RepID=UPI002180978B|nr:arylsulfatase B [Patella vulgata]
MAMNKTSFHLFILTVLCLCCIHGKKPHIVFIVADDLGWNDVGYHNPSMITPNIDKLAREGVILNQSYVQPLCSPSRSSFMSGYYPFRTGLQHLVILAFQPVCLPLNITILPQELKNLGYATHMVGKWHLGFCKWECTPTYRGFDSYFGYYNAREFYYNHTLNMFFPGDYLDYRDGKAVVKDQDGVYSTYAFAKRAESIISDHNASEPLFLYLPFQAVHEPIEVPVQYEQMYPNIQNEGRRKFCGMVSALDEAIGNVTLALKDKGIYNDTIILFTSDNGGWVPHHGNNYPLRGGKFTIYEGGTRGAAFIHGAGLQNTGRTYDGLIHAIDWLPTLVGAAGGGINGRDGQNLWPSISTGRGEERSEFVYNLDDSLIAEEGHAAIRMGDYKLVEGYPGLYPGWYKPETELPPLTQEQSAAMASENYNAYTYQLFNIKDDPTEHNDVSQKYPDIVEKLKARLDDYRKESVKPNYPFLPDTKSDPTNFNNVWSPGWC